MRLLIVNDEVIAAKGVMTGIDWKEYGIHEVDVAFEADTAKKLLTESRFDILLCDIEMPGESGIQLVQWIREEKIDIEVIFLTCHADFEFAQEAIRLQCKNYILVPSAYDVIAENVHEVVLEIEKTREARKYQQYGQLWIGEKEDELRTISSSPQDTVEKAENYIGKHLNDSELSVNKIAEQMYLNSDYLNRIFKRIKGQSIGHYILQKRMEMAADLLKQGNISATKIAELVGYNTYSAFVAAFKNHFGYPPSKHKI